MRMRVVVDQVAIIALPVVSLGDVVVLGGSVDPCQDATGRSSSNHSLLGPVPCSV